MAFILWLSGVLTFVPSLSTSMLGVLMHRSRMMVPHVIKDLLFGFKSILGAEPRLALGSVESCGSLGCVGI